MLLFIEVLNVSVLDVVFPSEQWRKDYGVSYLWFGESRVKSDAAVKDLSEGEYSENISHNISKNANNENTPNEWNQKSFVTF